MENTTKNRILKTLKDFGRLPTYRIAAIIGKTYYPTLFVLKEMNTEGLIEKVENDVSVYWKLKEEREVNQNDL